MRSPRLKLVVIGALLVLAVGLLDRLVYNRLVFLPKPAVGWDQFPWYVFEYHLKKLESARDPRPLVLIVGSSIAKYSVQKEGLEAELAARGTQARVEMVVHASMMPGDLRHYLPRLLALKPSAIVYITNPADLDLERYLHPWEAGSPYSDWAFRTFMALRHPMLLFYPSEFAWEQRGFLDFQEQIRLHLRGQSFALRFKSEWYDPLLFTFRAHRGDVKSYLNYQGIPIREGIWREGRTGGCFSLPRSVLEKRPLLVQTSNALFDEPTFRVSIFSAAPPEKPAPGPAAAPSSPSLCGEGKTARAVGQVRPSAAGWRALPIPTLPAGDWFTFVLSHVEDEEGKVLPVRAGDPAHRGFGLRLPGHLGLESPPTNDYLVRRPSLEDVRLAALSDSEYEQDFHRRVHPDDWARPERGALHQFNRLRLAKLMLHWRAFETIPPVREVESIAAALPPAVRLLIVNNPENPLTKESYDGSHWYAGYLDFFQKLERRPNIRFYDLRNSLPMQHFSDAHHLTYPGLLRMQSEYARIVAQSLARGQ